MKALVISPGTFESDQIIRNLSGRGYSVHAMRKDEASALKPSGGYIFLQRTRAYLRVGVILHLFCLTSLSLFVLVLIYMTAPTSWQLLWKSLLSSFLLSVSITTQMDAWSRYQNYKMMKDLFHIYGFRRLLVKPWSRSRCQRDAVVEAASQLGLRSSATDHFYSLGYRWYHIIPSVLIEDPMLLLSKGYWRTTFFVPAYQSRYFHW